MQVEEGLDSGPILYQTETKVTDQDTSGTLHARLAEQGATDLLHTLQLLQQDTLRPIPQENAKATYANKVFKEEALLDWHLPAIELDRKIRAFNPWPIAYSTLETENVRIWQAQVIDTTTAAAVPGTILKFSRAGIDVAAGQGILQLQTCQLPGKRAISAADFFNAHHDDFAPGKILGSIS